MKSLLIQEEVAWLDALPWSLSCMWWVEGLLIYFMLGSKLMHFIWNIALSFLGIGVRPLCSVTSHCHLQTAEWLHAQVSAASAWDHNCSIPCLGLVHWLAFQPSHWSINHAPNYMCTDICCMPGFSLASQWLLWIASDWSDCCIGVFSLAGLLPLHSPFCQSSRVRKCGLEWRDCEIFDDKR